MLHQSFDVHKVADSLDAEDYEPVPFTGVAILEVPPDSTPEIPSETDIVWFVASIEGIHPSIPTHELLQAFLEYRAREDLARQPLGHLFYKGALRVISRSVLGSTPHTRSKTIAPAA